MCNCVEKPAERLLSRQRPQSCMTEACLQKGLSLQSHEVDHLFRTLWSPSFSWGAFRVIQVTPFCFTLKQACVALEPNVFWQFDKIRDSWLIT